MSDSMKFFPRKRGGDKRLRKRGKSFSSFACRDNRNGIIQSSSAVTSIIISMAAAGIVIGSGRQFRAFYVVLGTNIGTLRDGAYVINRHGNKRAQSRAYTSHVQHLRRGIVYDSAVDLAGIYGGDL